MPIILVIEDEFSGGKELASWLAERLGFRQVDDEILYQYATARGADPDALRATLEKKVTVVDRFTHKVRIQICALEAALAEQMRSDNVVCYGTGSELLGLEAPFVVRLRVLASFASRVRAVEDALKLPGAEAKQYLNERDRWVRRWRTYLWGEGRYSGRLDLEVNLDSMSVGEVHRMLEGRIADAAVDPDASRATLENLALSTRVKAEVALHAETAHLEIAAHADHGAVVLQGKLRTLDEMSELRRAVLQIPGVTYLDTTQVQLPSSEFTIGTAADFPPTSRPRWLRIAWAGAVAAAVLAVSFGVLQVRRSGELPSLSAAGSALQTLTGVITDSKCGHIHSQATQDAACVRACVKQPGVKYALYDGSHAYVISNQQDGDRLAAKHVVVRGSVDQATGILRVASIEAATP